MAKQNANNTSFMKHTFVLSDENNVNSYGYRVLTDGIDVAQYMRNPVVLFMHERGNRGDEVIGRALSLKKENGQLIGEIEFDEADELAKKIAGKVERGFIRMASIHADITETSSDPAHLLPGQLYETVTKSELVELSIVDIGGNNNALKLSRNGQPVQLQQINKSNKLMKIEHIALALSLSATADEQQITTAISGLKTTVAQLTKEKEGLATQIKEMRTGEATALVEKAVALSLIHVDLKDVFLKAFDGDFDAQKAKLSKMIADAEKDGATDAAQGAVRKVVLGAQGKGGAAAPEVTFDDLQRNNVAELRRLRDEEPETYARLAKEYAAGKRAAKV